MNADELLKKLLDHFYVSSYGGLEWSYIEGMTIQDVTDDKFELELIPYLSEMKAKELKKLRGG
jgi:hypothetical protein